MARNGMEVLVAVIASSHASSTRMAVIPFGVVEVLVIVASSVRRLISRAGIRRLV